MSAVKQNAMQQQRFFYQQQKTIDLTQSRDKQMSLANAHNDSDDFTAKASRREAEMAHCAVLGYN